MLLGAPLLQSSSDGLGATCSILQCCFATFHTPRQLHFRHIRSNIFDNTYIGVWWVKWCMSPPLFSSSCFELKVNLKPLYSRIRIYIRIYWKHLLFILYMHILPRWTLECQCFVSSVHLWRKLWRFVANYSGHICVIKYLFAQQLLQHSLCFKQKM